MWCANTCRKFLCRRESEQSPAVELEERFVFILNELSLGCLRRINWNQLFNDMTVSEVFVHHVHWVSKGGKKKEEQSLNLTGTMCVGYILLQSK